MTRLLWVLEDRAAFTPAFDLFTTRALIGAAHRAGTFAQRITTVSRILWEGGAVRALSMPVIPAHLTGAALDFAGAEPTSVEAFDAVLLRVDPPITELYRHALILLAALEGRPGAPVFVNGPSAILARGSKLVNLRFAERLPDGLVSADADRLVAALEAAPAGALLVAKPLDRAGGEGVARLTAGDPGAGAALRALARAYGFVHLQDYVADVERCGEVRHLAFAGEVLAHWRKRPRAGDFRANLDRGAVAEPVAEPPAPAARAVIRDLWRAEPGFVFLSADFIGHRLNELNVENTGGLPTADRLYGRDHAAAVLDRLRALARGSRAARA